MFPNRVQYFIRNILQNSRLNRENFMKNKKIYKNILENDKTINAKLSNNNRKNYYNHIVRRNFGIYNFDVQPPNKGNDSGGPLKMFLIALTIYFVNGNFKVE